MIRPFRILHEIFPRLTPGVLCVCLLLETLKAASAQELEVPYVPTPQDIVYRMLEVARAEPGDYLIDLGSGDGRIVITAAQMGVAGHGVERRSDLIEEARMNARRASVSDRVVFLQQDLFEADLSPASVVTLYLLPEINVRLRPKLLRELRPGSRVVSHSFDMGNWTPDFFERPDAVHHVYLWIVPASIAGRWRWNLGDSRYSMQVEQKFQKVELDVRGDTPIKTASASLTGTKLTFTTESRAETVLYTGHVEENRIVGVAQIHREGTSSVEEWAASRDGPAPPRE